MSKKVGDYVITRKLGSGSFASVYKAHHFRYPDKEVAIKSISTLKLNKKLEENLTTEIGILRKIAHVNIVRLYGIHKSERHIYLIMEYCDGGDLHRYIRKHGSLSMETARHFMRQLCQGMKYLWEKSLIHRDLKPQNLLLSSNSSTAELKIADFGFARHLAVAAMAETLCGSPLYMAPEILKYHKYDAKADLWSAGTILFEMLTGRPPFHGSNPPELLRNIERTELMFPQEISINPDCRLLLKQLLRKDSVERISFEEFFQAKFLRLVDAHPYTSTDDKDLNFESHNNKLSKSQRQTFDRLKDEGGLSSATFSSNSENSGVHVVGEVDGSSGGRERERSLQKQVHKVKHIRDNNTDSDEAWEFVSVEQQQELNSKQKQKSKQKAKYHRGSRAPTSSLHIQRPSASHAHSQSHKSEVIHVLRYAEALGDLAESLGNFALILGSINAGEDKNTDNGWSTDLYSALTPFLNSVTLDNSSDSKAERDKGKNIPERACVVILLRKCLSIFSLAKEAADGLLYAGGQVREAADVLRLDFSKGFLKFQQIIDSYCNDSGIEESMASNPRIVPEDLILRLGLALGSVAAGHEAMLFRSGDTLADEQLESKPKSFRQCAKIYQFGKLMFEILAAEPGISATDLRTVRGYIAMFLDRVEKVKEFKQSKPDNTFKA